MCVAKYLIILIISFPLFGWELNHRLTPTAGNVKIVTIGVNLTNRLESVPKAVGGISINWLADYNNVPFNRNTGVYTLTESQENIIKDLKLPMSRAYSLAVDQPGTLNQMIDKAAYFFNRMNIPLSNVVLCFEHHLGHYLNFLPPEVYTNAIKYSHSKGYGFRRWEISNEPNWQNPANIGNRYFIHVTNVAAAIRKVAPDDLIGLHGYWSTEYGEKLMTNAKGHYDFLIMHHYSFVNPHSTNFENIVISDNCNSLSIVSKYNEVIKKVDPKIVQYDTEWGLHKGTNGYVGADYNATNGNIVGVMHRAVRLIYYVRENMMAGAGGWLLFGQNAHGFMTIRTKWDTPSYWDQRTLLYWFYYYFNRTVSDYVLNMSGTSPFHTGKSGSVNETFSAPSVPSVVMINGDNTEISVIAANANWSSDVPFSIDLSGGNIANVLSSVVLSHDSQSAYGYPFANSEVVTSNFSVSIESNKLTTTLPKHSLFFFRAKLIKQTAIDAGVATPIGAKIEVDDTRLGRVLFSNPSRIISLEEGSLSIYNLPVNSKVNIYEISTSALVSSLTYSKKEDIGVSVWHFEDNNKNKIKGGVYIIQIECGSEKIRKLVVLI